MDQLWISALLILYTGGLGFCMYYCVVADPETSSIALFLGYQLPDKIWSTLRRVCGERGANVLEWITNRALIFLYVVVVYGSWSVIFAYVYPWIARQTYVSQFHRIIGACVFIACAASWRHASTSSPGIITKDTLHLYNHYPFDNYMFEHSICRTRKIPRPARSKFDRYKYNENVPRFDHFCGWLYNTIGELNYRWFLLFLLVHVGMCVYGTCIVGLLFLGEVYEKGLHEAVFFDRSTGEEYHGSLWIICQYLFVRHTVEAAVLLLMSVMSIALALFLGYHVWLTSHGLTTNESFKWDEIKKWYKNELQRYEEAIKKGEVVEDGQNKPVVSDGDVTCTPTGQSSSGGGTQENRDERFDVNVVRHPGPKPVNIYNRGFWKNWEEVIFPMPLRKQRQLAADRKNV